MGKVNKINSFQFLIGRLKLEDVGQFMLLLPEFQFLIGRLKQIKEKKEKKRVGQFQFLIGRLKLCICFKKEVYDI